MTDLNHILNWRRWDENITMSGQPSEDQLADIYELGVTHVINLGPHHNKGALKDEAKSVSDLGMTYIYIPVEFESPTSEDFDTFCNALAVLKGQKVHVHCIYNARVSAFFYRYAAAGLGGSLANAHALMESIWRPGADWAEFVGDPAARDQPNLYAGDDY